MSRPKNWNRKRDILLGGPGEPMTRAVDASRNCVQEPGKECPTPSVGAVVVKDDEIIAVSYRARTTRGTTRNSSRLKESSKVWTSRELQFTPHLSRARNGSKTPCVEWIIERHINGIHRFPGSESDRSRLGPTSFDAAGIETHLFQPALDGSGRGIK